MLDGIGASDPTASVNRQLFLGTDRFVEKIPDKINKAVPSREVPRQQRPVKSLAVHARDAADRDGAIRAAYASGGYTLEQIGLPFGLHYSVISRIAGMRYSNAK